MNIDLSGAASIHPTANVDGASALGEHSYVGPWCDVVNSTCGRFTFLYGDIRLADDADYLSRRHGKGPVLGYDVWVGHGAVIMAGVHIGNGAVIGANAVVTHDVEPYQIVAGVPARPMGYRFGPDTIAALERIQWWNWSDAELKERMEELKDVPRFIRKYDPQ